MGDENKVGITLYQAGSVNREVEDLFLYGDSGIKYDAGTETGYENVTFPFYAKITYRTLNKLKTQQIDCYVEFEISQSGYWKVKIHN